MIRLIILVVLCLMPLAKAFADDIDTALSRLAEQVTSAANDAKKTKVTVIDFADLQGRQNELGRYIAEQLTVNLVLGKKTFAVLDRANLKSILAEHKLTAQGLVDPENAKRLGMFAGVDAIILGTIIPKKTNVSLTARIITTDTAEIVGAAKADFSLDDAVQQLLATPSADPAVIKRSESEIENTKVQKWVGNLGIGVESLRIVDGTSYLLTLVLTNRSENDSILVALHSDVSRNVKGSIMSPDGYEFLTTHRYVRGIELDLYRDRDDPLQEATEVKAGRSIITTIKFSPADRKSASRGSCTVQLEILISGDRTSELYNFVTRLEAK